MTVPDGQQAADEQASLVRAAPADLRRRQRRGENTRERILLAATTEFALHGLEGASIRAIARRAGVSHTRFVYYFDSKEGLWQAVALRTTSELTNRYAAPLELRGKIDDAELLRLLWTEYIRFSYENPEVSWIMSHLARERTTDSKWRIDQNVKPAHERAAQLIRSAQRTGKMIKGDPHHIHYLFLGAVTRIFMLRGEAEEFSSLRIDDPTFLKEHTRLILSLFFRDEAAPKTAGKARKAKPTFGN
jgi:AcrR family transcriptional regulator